MTNKYVVSQELLAKLRTQCFHGAVELVQEIDSILAAPVVERQPYGYWICPKGNPNLGSFHREILDTTEQYCDVTSLYTAPPELAELQATIARLTAENEHYKNGALQQLCDHLNENVESLQSEIERLKSESFESLKSESFESLYNEAVDEIERLKGGQGEQFDMAVSALTDIVKVSRMGEKPFEIATLAIGEMSAIASQTAPVSVPLPAFDGYQAHIVRELQAVFTQECERVGIVVDKVKELNQ